MGDGGRWKLPGHQGIDKGLGINKLAARGGFDANRGAIRKKLKILESKKKKKLIRYKEYKKLVSDFEADEKRELNVMEEAYDEKEKVTRGEEVKVEREKADGGVEIVEQKGEQGGRGGKKKNKKKKKSKPNPYAKELKAYEELKAIRDAEKKVKQEAIAQREKMLKESAQRRKAATRTYRKVNKRGQPQLASRIQNVLDKLHADKK